jgi:hypothetical protein
MRSARIRRRVCRPPVTQRAVEGVVAPAAPSTRCRSGRRLGRPCSSSRRPDPRPPFLHPRPLPAHCRPPAFRPTSCTDESARDGGASMMRRPLPLLVVLALRPAVRRVPRAAPSGAAIAAGPARPQAQGPATRHAGRGHRWRAGDGVSPPPDDDQYSGHDYDNDDAGTTAIARNDWTASGRMIAARASEDARRPLPRSLLACCARAAACARHRSRPVAPIHPPYGDNRAAASPRMLRGTDFAPTSPPAPASSGWKPHAAAAVPVRIAREGRSTRCPNARSR